MAAEVITAMDLEVDQIAPAFHPFIQQPAVVALHDLEAAAEAVGDSAGYVAESVARQAPLVAEAAVDGDRVAASEVFDDPSIKRGQIYFPGDRRFGSSAENRSVPFPF